MTKLAGVWGAMLCLVLPTQLAAQSQEDAVPIGWKSSAQPFNVIFETPDAACEAQWQYYQGDNPSSRFVGIKSNSDNWGRVDCVWTSFQYLCPEPGQDGGIAACGTVLPSTAQIACPSNYIATADGYCRLNAAREQDCNPCVDNGKPNPKTSNPVIISTGSKYLEALDYMSADGLFRIGRQYRSSQVGRPFQNRVLPRSQPRGLHGSWNFDFSRELQFGVIAGTPTTPNATVAILLPDGTGHAFVLKVDGTWAEETGSVYAGSSDNLKLELIGALPADLATLRDAPTTWRLTDETDSVWIFETRVGLNGGPYVYGWPTSMTTRSGYAQTFTYAADSSLASLSDSFGRTATFEWDKFVITTRTTVPVGSEPVAAAVSKINLPDGTSLNYIYENIPPPDRTVVYSGAKWQSTGAGGSAPSGTRASISFVPKVKRLASVERRSATGETLDSVSYLHENRTFSRNITGIIDNRDVRVASIDYDGAGRVTKSELADGAESNSFAYGMSGAARTRVVTNELGKRHNYTFGEFSSVRREYQLTSIAGDASPTTPSSTTTLSYGGGTFLASTTDAEGRTVTTTRDARGRPTVIVEASGTPDQRTTTVTWHPTFNLPASVVTERLTETRSYDAQGRLETLTLTDTTGHTSPYPTNGQTRTFTYSWDTNGRLLSQNGPLVAQGTVDDITSYSYDAAGNMLTMTNALGQVTSYAGHDANGRPASMTDPNGVVTTFAYDPLGRIAAITVKHPTDPAFDATTSMVYDAVGNVTELALPGTAPLLMEYDGANRVAVMRSSSGERFEFAYDPMGNVTRETVKRTDGSTARFVRREFDELGRLMTERLGLRSPTRLGYDKVSNLAGFTDPNGAATTSAFDALDRVISKLTPDGGTQASTYDKQDNALTFTDPIAVTTQFTYNGFGEVIRENSPDRGANTYEYDAAGRLTKSTDGRGQVVNYTHDILGRVTRMEPVGRPVSEVIEYHWDTGGLAGSYGVGRLAQLIDGSGTTLFQYDHRGNQTVQQQVIGTNTTAQLAYTYDPADRITQITYPSGRQVRYGYDTLGRVNLVETRANAATPTWQVIASGHQYEPFGPVKAMALGNGLAVANDWGTDGFLAERRLVATSSGTALSHLAYGRDEVGRIGAIADQLVPPNSVLYGYDLVGRLTMAVSSSASAGSETYAYNPGTNQLASVTDASGTRTVSYDGRGNTVAETRPGGVSVAASYDGHARLESYDRSNIGAQTYSYNGLGDRVRVDKPTGTRHFVYDSQGRVVAEYGASASEVKAEFIWAVPPAANDNSPFGGDDGIVGYAPLALVAENGLNQLELYWVHGNHLGVPIVTTNALGQVVDPGDDFLRPGFPGQSQVLSDLYYNRARDYDPVLGRYIQADPIGLLGDVNPYLYAGADPVNMIDPLGTESVTIPSRGQVIDAAVDWWLKRQVKNAATRRLPLVGQALSAGDAIGGTIAVIRFLDDCGRLEMAQNNKQRRKRIEGLQEHIRKHREKMSRDPKGPWVNDWKKEIETAMIEIEQIRKRLPNGK
ncbi:MAG: RHS repeat-associated core domain-containing protein [Erythrobacter sp.]|nr:RHS repeat-associated core domain-containing protein [Erythrobacter sp.]MDZ4272683.1 RHS repeat-associated core domain-containing protein [Erythrobacter sp.]